MKSPIERKIFDQAVRLIGWAKVGKQDDVYAMDVEKTDKIAENIAEFAVKALNNQDTALNIGRLRQWLNEDRIKDGARFVTNEDLEHWLKVEGQDTLEGLLIELPKEINKCVFDLYPEDDGKWRAWYEPMGEENPHYNLSCVADTPIAAVDALRDKLREEKLC